METPRSATLVSDFDRHFIDHLAPISENLDIPMIVSNEEIESLVNTYYPNIKTLYLEPLELAPFTTENFEIIYTCLPTPLFNKLFFVDEVLTNKKLFNIWCPHGNSDKGYLGNYMETLCEEKHALVYGQKLIHFLSEKESLDQLESVIVMGNYRYDYYLKNKSFFQKKLEEFIPFRGSKTILYAPTWRDCEDSSSFDATFKLLIETLPDHWNLIIKPHPNLFPSPELLELFLYPYLKKNISILSDFPPVYPVLDFVDVYLGDMSSVGYDFLTFQKPMFFFNTNKRDPKRDKGLYLTQCGTLIEPEDYKETYAIIEKTEPTPFRKRQEELYHYVFGHQEDLIEKIDRAYEKKYQSS